MDKKKLLGKRIKELRRSRKLTQEQLGEMVNIELSSLGNIENGYNYPLLSTLEKLSNVLNCSIEDMFNFEHIEDNKLLIEQINRLLNENPDKIKQIYKVIKAIIN